MSSVRPISVAREILHQPAPLADHVIHRARPPGVAGDRFGAVGALVGAPTAGHDGVGPRLGVQPVGEWLEVGVARDLEEVVRRVRDAVEVRDQAGGRVDDDLAVLSPVEAVDRFHSAAAFERVHELEDAHVGLALDDVVDFRMLVADRFLGQQRQVRAAEHGGQAQRLAPLGHRPGVVDQRRDRGDAQQLVAAAAHDGLQRLILDGRVVDAHLVAAFAQHTGQIAQTQRNMLARCPDARLRTGQQNSHEVPPYPTDASIAWRSSVFSLRGTTVRHAMRALRPKLSQKSLRLIARAMYLGRQ